MCEWPLPGGHFSASTHRFGPLRDLRTQTDAERVQVRLARQNISANVQRVALDADVWFRIRIGRPQARAAANGRNLYQGVTGVFSSGPIWLILTGRQPWLPH
jgi:hypothetical protein